MISNSYKRKIILSFLIMLIIPFIPAISISNLDVQPSSINLPYTGDSENVIVSFANENFECDINCYWEWKENGKFIYSDSKSEIRENQIFSIDSSFTASGQSPRNFEITVSCQNSNPSLFCGSDIIYKSASVKMEFGYCGDVVRNGNEECDGSDHNGKSCSSQGFDGGILNCFSCGIDTSDCYKCGDGIKNGNEECDGSDFNGKSCSSLGYNSGYLSCDSSCKIKTSECSSCGNYMYDPGETCSNCPSDVVCEEGYSCSNDKCEINIKELKETITEKVSEELEEIKEEIKTVEIRKDFLDYIYIIIGAIAAVVGIVWKVMQIRSHKKKNLTKNKKAKKKKSTKKKISKKSKSKK